MMSEMSIALIITAIISLFAVVGAGDYQDAVQQEAAYCEMVKLHKKTNGESGWPDYKGSYAERC